MGGTRAHTVKNQEGVTCLTIPLTESFNSSNVPLFSTIISALQLRSVLDIWLRMRLWASSSDNSGFRRMSRWSWRSSFVDTVRITPQKWWRPDSKSKGTSIVTIRCPWRYADANWRKISLLTAPCTILFNFFNRSGLPNTALPSSPRLSDPSGATRSGTISEKVSTTCWYALRPGSTTWRAILSASTTGTPQFNSSFETVDLPEAIPPVSPRTSIDQLPG